MEEREWGENGGDEKGLIVGVGLTGGRKSKYILKWALDKFLPESNGKVTFKLFHVYPKITSVPTPMGNWLPIAQVRDDVAAGYIKEVQWKKKKYLLQFQQILKAKKIKSEIVMLESNDIAMAISLEIERDLIRHLVVGVSSTTIFSRKNLTIRKMLGDSQNLSTVISETAPDFCSVYIISDGKLQHMRPTDSEEPTAINIGDISGRSTASTDSCQSSSSLSTGRLFESEASSPISGNTELELPPAVTATAWRNSRELLVYEYMENGSLADRLFRKDNQPPLLWYDRFRICWEVASALTFLHNTKPKPIIHRNLKPANILLDQNLVSKIGGTMLETMLNMEPTSVSTKTRNKESSPVGTFCYIDPEYQRTGRASTKSDVYAFGVVMLQLLTAKPAVGVTYIIEDAIDEGNLMDVLDLEAGDWPKKETFDLALIALQCAELRGRDRPDLREKILPFLEGLKEVADKAKESASRAHFICPILNDIMEDPYVAADGCVI